AEEARVKRIKLAQQVEGGGLEPAHSRTETGTRPSHDFRDPTDRFERNAHRTSKAGVRDETRHHRRIRIENFHGLPAARPWAGEDLRGTVAVDISGGDLHPPAECRVIGEEARRQRPVGAERVHVRAAPRPCSPKQVDTSRPPYVARPPAATPRT